MFWFTVPPLPDKPLHVRRSGITSYDHVFDRVDWGHKVEIRVGDVVQSDSLFEVLGSLGGVIHNRLFHDFWMGKSLCWERLLSESWRLVIHKNGRMASISLEPVGWVVDRGRIGPVEVDPTVIRDAIVDLIEWAIAALESRIPWIQKLENRDEFTRKLHELKQCSFRAG